MSLGQDWITGTRFNILPETTTKKTLDKVYKTRFSEIEIGSAKQWLPRGEQNELSPITAQIPIWREVPGTGEGRYNPQWREKNQQKQTQRWYL